VKRPDAGSPDPLHALKTALREWQKAKKRAPSRPIIDPPDRRCHHAVILGIQCDNGRGGVPPRFAKGPRVGEYRRFFRFRDETVYVWTHPKDEHSVLVADVPPAVKAIPVWRSVGSALSIAFQLSTVLEWNVDLSYAWICDFRPKRGWTEQHFLNETQPPEGIVESLRYWADIAPVLELLQRDERFFVAAQHLTSSVMNHWFCLICALRRAGYVKHPNREPPVWQLVQWLPQMEAAIVQATRAIEAILGKPGSRERPAKLDRMLKRWRAAINLDSAAVFAPANRTNLDYYFGLFEVRNASAHSFGKLPASFRRELAVRAQSFAWTVVEAYLVKHALPRANAIEALSFNKSLLRAVSKEFGTKLTGR
jgi:hypothetical protein